MLTVEGENTMPLAVTTAESAAPHAITVVASTCLEAGTLSTLAMLEGNGAAEFLRDAGVQFRIH